MRKADYIEIHNDLRKEIESGMRIVGDSLPTENELAAHYKCSRPTIRKALSLLEYAGLIQRRPGVGSTITRGKTPSVSNQELTIAIDLPSGLGRLSCYYDQLIAGMNEVLRQYNGVLRLVGDDDVFNLTKKDVDGVVIVQANDCSNKYEKYIEMVKKDVPIVMINRFPQDLMLGYLSVNYQYEVFKIIHRMITNGTRRIAVVGGDESKYVNFERIKGWRQAFLEESLPVPEELLFNFDSPKRDFSGLVQGLQSEKIDVLFVLHGIILPNVVNLIYQAGKRDIPVFCFDDMEQFCEMSDIAISYVKMPLKRMGRIAVEYFMERRDNPILTPPKTQFPISVVVNDCKYLL